MVTTSVFAHYFKSVYSFICTFEIQRSVDFSTPGITTVTGGAGTKVEVRILV